MSEKCQFCKKLVGPDDVTYQNKPAHVDCVPVEVMATTGAPSTGGKAGSGQEGQDACCVCGIPFDVIVLGKKYCRAHGMEAAGPVSALPPAILLAYQQCHEADKAEDAAEEMKKAAREHAKKTHGELMRLLEEFASGQSSFLKGSDEV